MPTEENVEGQTRLHSYKNRGKSCDEMRRRRNEVSVELRKARKDDQLLKRRNIDIDEITTSPLQENQSNNTPTVMSMEMIMDGMQSSQEDMQLKATAAARKTLSRERNPPIDEMIKMGLVPRCIDFLSNFHNPDLQFEAAWALTNVASGTSEQTNAVIKGGGVPKFVALLASPYSHVAEQAVWGLGNIAGDGPAARDLVLSYNAVNSLLSLINPNTPLPFLRNIVWALSNLCRNKNPPPSFESVKPCLAAFSKLLHYTDNDVLADTCWALSYLTDGSNDKIQAVVDTGVVPKLVELLANSEVKVLTPALRAVGNIVTGNDLQTDSIIQGGGLGQLALLLQHPRPNIVKEAAWTVSNITAGNVDQIQEVINNGLLPPLIRVLQTGDYKSQKEAAWAVTNYTSGGSVEQIATLVQLGVLPHICNLLDSKDWKTVNVALDGISNILAAAEKMGEVTGVATYIEECGGLDKLELLQTHENEQIYQKVVQIIDTYFSGDEDDPNVAPTTTSEGAIEFNARQNVPQGGFSF
ncbi:importin subunit alpha-1 [Homalodisca vitripennis]|uniref:importin subunit alpha-1 n=1 Tax=Homalodisca vitripennis TaxID=197043 RepID=UPI001EEBBDE7|nr:importin subunit alpha-1 [Homalodisca vitripennis]